MTFVSRGPGTSGSALLLVDLVDSRTRHEIAGRRRAGPAQVEGVGRLELFGEEAARPLVRSRPLLEEGHLGDLVDSRPVAKVKARSACCLAPVGFLIRA